MSTNTDTPDDERATCTLCSQPVEHECAPIVINECVHVMALCERCYVDPQAQADRVQTLDPADDELLRNWEDERARICGETS